MWDVYLQGWMRHEVHPMLAYLWENILEKLLLLRKYHLECIVQNKVDENGNISNRQQHSHLYITPLFLLWCLLAYQATSGIMKILCIGIGQKHKR